MLHAAARFNAQKLLINCCNYLFFNYSTVEDNGNLIVIGRLIILFIVGHEGILYVLENVLEH